VARSRVFRQLTSLGVRDDRRGGGTMVRELARLADPPRLKKLDLSSSRLANDAPMMLVASRALEFVEDLNLSDNNLGAVGISALARGELPSLQSLHLLRTRPQEGGVDALAAAGFLPRLGSLSLGGNNLGPAAAFPIANPPQPLGLCVLDLRENRLGDRAAASLAKSPHFANLVLLDLAETQIGDAGANALADSPHLGGLIYLNLYGNAISPRAESRLRARFGDRVFL
jgi:hypothetical protein